MSKRIFLGGLLRAVLAFLVSSTLHLATSLDEASVQNLPNEDVGIAARKDSIQAPGFSLFPGTNRSPGRTKQ
jgi:hypothetical protein